MAHNQPERARCCISPSERVTSFLPLTSNYPTTQPLTRPFLIVLPIQGVGIFILFILASKNVSNCQRDTNQPAPSCHANNCIGTTCIHEVDS
jgi:hypothetical protein